MLSATRRDKGACSGVWSDGWSNGMDYFEVRKRKRNGCEKFCVAVTEKKKVLFYFKWNLIF